MNSIWREVGIHSPLRELRLLYLPRFTLSYYTTVKAIKMEKTRKIWFPNSSNGVLITPPLFTSTTHKTDCASSHDQPTRTWHHPLCFGAASKRHAKVPTPVMQRPNLCTRFAPKPSAAKGTDRCDLLHRRRARLNRIVGTREKVRAPSRETQTRVLSLSSFVPAPVVAGGATQIRRSECVERLRNKLRQKTTFLSDFGRKPTEKLFKHTHIVIDNCISSIPR